MADPKSYKLEISGPGLRFVVIYMRPVRDQTGVRISRLGPATETKSHRSEFIFRPDVDKGFFSAHALHGPLISVCG